MNSSDAIKKIIIHEGGDKYTNHSADRGGPTRYGITLKTLTAWRGKATSADDVKNLKESEAIAIYKSLYWDKVKGDEIPYSMAIVLFDQAVNRGVSTVVKQAQKILGITQDGIAGPQFVLSIKKLSESNFIGAFLSESEKSYRSIASNNPSQNVFLNGWLNRVDSLKEYAMANIGVTTAISGGVVLLVVFFLIILTSSKTK